jgi:hypothetical protein
MLHMDKIAAGLFFLSYSFMLAGRITVIKAASKKENEKPGPVENVVDKVVTAFTPDHK